MNATLHVSELSTSLQDNAYNLFVSTPAVALPSLNGGYSRKYKATWELKSTPILV